MRGCVSRPMLLLDNGERIDRRSRFYLGQRLALCLRLRDVRGRREEKRKYVRN